jgi:hypothetical protein
VADRRQGAAAQQLEAPLEVEHVDRQPLALAQTRPGLGQPLARQRDLAAARRRLGLAEARARAALGVEVGVEALVSLLEEHLRAVEVAPAAVQLAFGRQQLGPAAVLAQGADQVGQDLQTARGEPVLGHLR